MPFLLFIYQEGSRYRSLFFLLFRAPPTHMKVPRLEVEREPQLLAYTPTTAIATPIRAASVTTTAQAMLDPKHTERGQGSTHNLMVPNRIPFHCTTTGTPRCPFKSKHFSTGLVCLHLCKMLSSFSLSLVPPTAYGSFGGQGANPNHSCDLPGSCRNTRSCKFLHWAGGIQRPPPQTPEPLQSDPELTSTRCKIRVLVS